MKKFLLTFLMTLLVAPAFAAEKSFDVTYTELQTESSYALKSYTDSESGITISTYAVNQNNQSVIALAKDGGYLAVTGNSSNKNITKVSITAKTSNKNTTKFELKKNSVAYNATNGNLTSLGGSLIKEITISTILR